MSKRFPHNNQALLNFHGPDPFHSKNQTDFLLFYSSLLLTPST